jgi:hypothetical protein
MIESRFEAIR